MLRSLDLVTTTAPWYTLAVPKPMYESDRAVAYWDIPLYAETTYVRANRIDATIINKQSKEIILLEMSCPWIENREAKSSDKTTKYGPLRWELQQRYPGYRVTQHNIIIDVLGGYSQDLTNSLKLLVGTRYRSVLAQMQRSVITSSLHIARSFKVVTK